MAISVNDRRRSKSPDGLMASVPDINPVKHPVDWSRAFSIKGTVTRAGDAVALVAGLEEVGFEELVLFDSGAVGLAYDLRESTVGVVVLTGADRVVEGQGVVAVGGLPEMPLGASILGRVVDPLGNALDEGPNPLTGERLPLFRDAPAIVDRTKVRIPLHTGILAIDAAVPIGRGQRELVIGDRNVGKTTLALDIVAAQSKGDVACIYVVVGQPMSRVRAVRDTLEAAGCLDNVAIVAADASMSAGMRYLAPYSGTSLAEWFRAGGGHALVVYDDLTKHADAYRELALVLDRSPGREAYPADIFYLHAEILERAAALRPEDGGGTLTAIPIVETTDGDISSYIPTNLISITDGQIHLDSSRFDRNLRPAIDVTRSVSRIGSVAQPPSLRAASKNLRIALSRFESLEALTRAGLDMDPAMQASMRRGQAIRELLRQPPHSPRSVSEQVLMLTIAGGGRLDDIDIADVGAVVEKAIDLISMEDRELLDSAAETQPDGPILEQLNAFVDRAKVEALNR